MKIRQIKQRLNTPKHVSLSAKISQTFKSKKRSNLTKTIPCLLIAAVAISLLPLPAHAARTEVDYRYTKAFGGTGADSAIKVATDSTGNIYLTGSFTSTVNFNPDGTDNHTSNGNTDIFLTKFNTNGSYGWTKTMGGTGADSAFGITIDSSYNIYLTGQFRNTVNFNPDGTDNHTSNGNTDIFLTKFNTDGSYGWTKTMGGTGADSSTNVALGTDNNIYLAGAFSNTVNFNPDGTADERTSNGGLDSFLTSFAPDGTYRFTKAFGGTGSDGSYNVALGTDNNVYLAGAFSNTVNFNPDGTDEHTSNGDLDAFLTSFAPDGTYRYTKAFGGTGGDFALWSPAIDTNNNIYVSGVFSDTVDFNSDGTADERTSNGATDIFLTSFTSTGTYRYTKAFGGTGSEQPTSIITGPGDNIYLAGAFSNTVNFNPDGTADERTSNGGLDSFLTSFAPDGTYRFTKAFGGIGTDAGRLAFDHNENLYMAGQFESTVNFNPDGTTDERTSNGGHDAFLTSYHITDYHHITGLASNLELIDPATGTSATDPNEGIEYTDNAALRLVTSSGLPIADITVDMTADRDWSTVSGGVDPSSGKAFVHNLSSAPGTASTYSLYTPKLAGHEALGICPGATTLDQVVPDCSGLKAYTQEDSNVKVVTIDDKQYWLVSSLTGTGGFSAETLAATGMSITTLITIISLLLITALGLGIYSRFRVNAYATRA